MQRAVRDTFMVRRLQERAKQRAKDGATGTASHAGITVAWYPGCERYAWFDESGAITKRLAVKLLENQGK